MSQRFISTSLLLCTLISGPVFAKASAQSTTSAVAGAGYKLNVVRAKGLGAPRGVIEQSDGSLLITDFGGWTKNKGRLLLVTAQGTGEPKVLFSKLDRPHGITVGPDRKVYVGEVGRVFRFDPTASSPTKEYVIGAVGAKGAAAAMPIREPHKHPLTQMLFLHDGSMLVNLGSNSNNCENEAKTATCKAATGLRASGVVRKYTFDKPGGKVVAWTTYASGLRNSMGLLQHSSGTVLQIENGRDAIDEADPRLSDDLLPHDEVNELLSGANYGWPYCYDNRVNSPEFKKYDCKTTSAPVMLLPAHCAPLGMAYWNNELVIAYHGYRDTGHRVVSFALDAKGKPIGKPKEIIGGWAETDDNAPGGPVGVTVTKDNSLLVVDDRNGTLMRVTK